MSDHLHFLGGASDLERIVHYLLSYGTGYDVKEVEDKSKVVIIGWDGKGKVFDIESLARSLDKVSSSTEIYEIYDAANESLFDFLAEEKKLNGRK